MIAKIKDLKAASNKFEQAGDAAEEQMAFYLRRAFGDSPDVFVLNDLRLVDGEDAAQIDHLVMHQYGMFIIESKSVSGEVTVDKHDEWTRKWGNQRTGMPSPIQQALRQGEFLRKLLREHAEELRDKYIFGLVQGGFKSCPIGLCVAISDRGVINRKGCDPPELCKADKVCERITAEIEKHRKGSSLLSKMRNPDNEYGLYEFRPAELERIKAFLLARHTPMPATSAPRPPAINTEQHRIPVAGPVSSPPPPTAVAGPPPSQASVTQQQPETTTCKHCGSNRLQGAYGQYGYYFKCISCGKNTPMDFKCRSCGAKGRIRKQGPQFHRVCGCGAEQLVWTNV